MTASELQDCLSARRPATALADALSEEEAARILSRIPEKELVDWPEISEAARLRIWLRAKINTARRLAEEETCGSDRQIADAVLADTLRREGQLALWMHGILKEETDQ